MADEPLYMLDMEAQLDQDASGAYRKQVLEQLSGCLGEVKAAMDAGLPPETFQRVEKLKDAVEAAGAVVEKVWDSIHASR
jgi:type III secretion system YseE family protein